MSTTEPLLKPLVLYGTLSLANAGTGQGMYHVTQVHGLSESRYMYLDSLNFACEKNCKNYRSQSSGMHDNVLCTVLMSEATERKVPLVKLTNRFHVLWC